MKYDFSSVSVLLPEQKQADALRAKFQPYLQVYRQNVLAFIEEDMIDGLIVSLTERTAFEHSHEEELFEQTVLGALENIRKKFEKILADDRAAISVTDRYENYFEEYHPDYLNQLSEKLNIELQKTCESLVDAALAAKDVSMKKGNWENLYLDPVRVPDAEYYYYCLEKISRIMHLQTHEVSDFLYDTVCFNQYKEIIQSVDDLPREERKKFFKNFDEIIEAIQKHYIKLVENRIANQEMTWNDNDPGWGQIAREMAPTIKIACVDITNAFIAARYSRVHAKRLYQDFVPA